MNVLFLTFTYPSPDEPTAGVFVREHARAAARHANVAVVHLQRGGGRYSIEEVPGEEFRTLRVRYPRSPLSYWRHFAGALAATRRLRREGFEPDLIHAHVFLAALPPLLLRRAFRVPVVVSEHWSVFLPEDPLELSRPVLAAARLALPRAARVLPVSEALRTGMEAHGIHARYEVVPNAVDPALFHPGEGGSSRLLTVGGLYEAKRVDVLLEALTLLPGVELDVVGDGPLRERYEELAASLGLSERVIFHGYRPKDDVARMMREAAVFVLASDFETGSCVLIEAAASGAPIVSTAAGATAEIVAATGGLLAERDDPELLASRIRETLDGAGGDRAEIARRARERYGLERVGEQLREIYERSVSSSKVP